MRGRPPPPAPSYRPNLSPLVTRASHLISLPANRRRFPRIRGEICNLACVFPLFGLSVRNPSFLLSRKFLMFLNIPERGFIFPLRACKHPTELCPSERAGRDLSEGRNTRGAIWYPRLQAQIRASEYFCRSSLNAPRLLLSSLFCQTLAHLEHFFRKFPSPLHTGLIYVCPRYGSDERGPSFLAVPIPPAALYRVCPPCTIRSNIPRSSFVPPQ